MIEEFGRLPFLQLQVHLNAVSLVGTDQLTRHVEGEPLLVVGLDTHDEFVGGDREAVLLSGGQQIIHRNPPSRLKLQPEFVGSVPQVLCQVFADPDQSLVHDPTSSCPGVDSILLLELF